MFLRSIFSAAGVTFLLSLSPVVAFADASMPAGFGPNPDLLTPQSKLNPTIKAAPGVKG